MKEKTLSDYIYEFIKLKKEEENWSLIVQDVLYVLLGDFVSELQHKNVNTPHEAHLIHLENYLHEYLKTYENMIHETVQEFFSYLKKGNDE